jgi:hypothetical protein
MEVKRLSLSKSSKSNSMKKYIYIQYTFALISLISVAFSFSACDGDDGPSAVEKQMKLLAGTWTMSSVTVDGVDQSSIFDGFKLTFTDTPATYEPVNGGKVWATGGSFRFNNNDATDFIRSNDGVVVTITSITENSLVLQMEWNRTTLDLGRIKSIAGNHEFVFSK